MVENIKRSTQIGQILLDLNIAPIELNTLILDYEKPNTNDLIGIVATVGHISSFAVDDLYIYMCCTNEKTINIFGKYNYLRINTIKSTIDETDKNTPQMITVDENRIYVFMIMINSPQRGHIRIFEKDGTYIKSIETELYEIVDISVDDKYIYIAATEEIIKRFCKNGSNDEKKYMTNGYDIYHMLVQDEYIYSVEDGLNGFDEEFAIVVYDIKNGSSTNYINICCEEKDGMARFLIASDGNKLYFYGRTNIKQMITSEKLLPIVSVLQYQPENETKQYDFRSMKVDDDYIYLLENSRVFILSK